MQPTDKVKHRLDKHRSRLGVAHHADDHIHEGEPVYDMVKLSQAQLCSLSSQGV